MQEIAKSSTKLSDFPPKLRKLGQYLLNIGEFITLKQGCKDIGLNYESITSMIWKCNQRGLNYLETIDNNIIEQLSREKRKVYRSLAERAIEGSGFHQKLFSQLVGDYVDKQEIKHDVGLTFVFTAQEIPEDLKRTREKEKEIEKVIDTTAEQIK